MQCSQLVLAVLASAAALAPTVDRRTALALPLAVVPVAARAATDEVIVSGTVSAADAVVEPDAALYVTMRRGGAPQAAFAKFKAVPDDPLERSNFEIKDFANSPDSVINRMWNAITHGGPYTGECVAAPTNTRSSGSSKFECRRDCTAPSQTAAAAAVSAIAASRQGTGCSPLPAAGSGGLSGGAIAGIAIGSAAAVFLIVLGAWWLRRRSGPGSAGARPQLDERVMYDDHVFILSERCELRC